MGSLALKCDHLPSPARSSYPVLARRENKPITCIFSLLSLWGGRSCIYRTEIVGVADRHFYSLSFIVGAIPLPTPHPSPPTAGLGPLHRLGGSSPRAFWGLAHPPLGLYSAAEKTH